MRRPPNFYYTAEALASQPQVRCPAQKKEREAFLTSRLIHFASPLQRTPNPGPAPRTAVHLERRPDHRRPLLYPGQTVVVGVHGGGVETYAVVLDHQVNAVAAKGQVHGHLLGGASGSTSNYRRPNVSKLSVE